MVSLKTAEMLHTCAHQMEKLFDETWQAAPVKLERIERLVVCFLLRGDRERDVQPHKIFPHTQAS